MIEVATGKETGEAIDRAQFGPPSWTDDNRLLYNRLPKLAPDAPKSDKYLRSRAYVHAIGSDPERDRAILGLGVVPDMALDPLATPFVFTAPGSPYVIGIVGNGNQREFSLYAAPVGLAGTGRPGMAARRRPRRRGDRCRAHRQHALSADAQERAALQGRAARSRESGPRDARRWSCRRATR